MPVPRSEGNKIQISEDDALFEPSNHSPNAHAFVHLFLFGGCVLTVELLGSRDFPSGCESLRVGLGSR